MSAADKIHLVVELLEAASAANAAAAKRLSESRAAYAQSLATLRLRQREFDNLVAEINAQHAAAGSIWSIDPPIST